MRTLRLLLLLAVGLAGPTVFSGAEKIPSLLQVSPLLPASEQQNFLSQRAKILERWRDFKEASDRFNRKAAELQTDQEFDRLNKERAAYIEAVNQFNTVIVARMAALDSVDTRVVDARDVPSGLSPGMDRAIAEAYANAPLGVADRVRKGFQAVMARDWKVAQAWFEDALTRDPTNAGLKRLASLAGSAGVNNPQANPQPAGKSTQVPADDDVLLLFDPDGWGLMHAQGTATGSNSPSAFSDRTDDFLLFHDPVTWRKKHPDWWKEIPQEPNVTTTLPDGTLQIQLPHPRLLESDPESWAKIHPDWWKNIPANAVVTATAPNGKVVTLPHPSDSELLLLRPAEKVEPKQQVKEGPHN